MTSRPRRSIGAAVASLAVLATALVAAPVAHAAQIGTLTVSPATGTATTVSTFDTNGQCPAGETVRVKVYGGDGTPAATIADPATINSPKNIVGSVDAGGFNLGSGMAIPSPSTWGDFASTGAPVLTKLNGTYKVRAWCSGGDWFEGSIVFTGTDIAGATYAQPSAAVAPGAPTTVKAVAGDARATVSWAAPASDGGSAITGYTVTSAPTGRTCTTTGARACVVLGLVDGVKYTFTVKATNALGTSVASAPSAAVVPFGVLKKISAKVILISGTARVGYTVKAYIPSRTFYSSSGSIYSGITYTYLWKRGTAYIKGATKSAYKLTKLDKGKRITVVVVAHKVGFKALAAASKYIVVK
jgi:hypothetical protein